MDKIFYYSFNCCFNFEELCVHSKYELADIEEWMNIMGE